jgi:enoyl-CoA hydratase/carnithine racemase
MAKDPINAYFTLRGSQVVSQHLWYSPKPVIFVCEGDLVAGWFELALYSNYFMVTKHARLGAPEVKRGLTLPFGSHALQFRAGVTATQQLMASGELITGEEAVRLGIADELIPDGVDPVRYAIDLCQKREFIDKIRQVSLLRQYGPPIGKLVNQSIRNYVRLLRSRETRDRIASFVKEEETA